MSLLEDQYEFRVSFEPFLLHPKCPTEGIAHNQPPGGDPNDPGVQFLQEIGMDLGMEFRLLCPVIPNTIYAHILIEYSKTQHDLGLQSQVIDRLFRAYFTKGRTLDKKHILNVAEKVGLNVLEADLWLNDPTKEELILQKATHWHSMGIEAIPFMFMNGKSIFCGDQDEAALITSIKKVAEKFPLKYEDVSL